MSHVSGVVLCTSCCEEDDDEGNSALWNQVNAWLADNDFAPLVRVEDNAGGTKHPQMLIGCAGYKDFAAYEDEFAAFVMALDWSCPSNVVLTIQPEETSTRIWRPRGEDGVEPRR